LICFFLAEKGLCLDTLDEERLKKIRCLEAYARPQKEEVEAPGQKPVFITPLNRYVNIIAFLIVSTD
jgi:titin